MKRVIKDALILFGITLVAGLMLGIVHEVTLEPIARQGNSAKVEAYQLVFSEGENFELNQAVSLEDRNKVVADLGYNGISLDEENIVTTKSGDQLGYVYTITTKNGYNGEISFTLGVDLSGKVTGLSFLEIAETPGLGMKAPEELPQQVVNKTEKQFVVVKSEPTADNQVQSISGATITSDAIVVAINAALAYFNETY